MRIWNRDEVMSDVIWAIRKVQPDILINRFSHDTKRRTHGHHTASAILSHEAFDLVGDKNVYPEQLKYVDTWQPSRLFFNTSWWFYGSRDKFSKADKSDMLSVDAGVFYPSLGKSNNEIAAESRSMHKCQSMGSTPSRGRQLEYMQWLKGDKIDPAGGPFQGINTTWSRLEGGEKIGKMLAKVESEFNFSDPSASVPALVEIYDAMNALPDSRWKSIKSEELKNLIINASGLYLEAVANSNTAVIGDELDLRMELTNRSNSNIKLKGISIPSVKWDSLYNTSLPSNEAQRIERTISISSDFNSSNAYWLNKEGSYGMYEVEDQLLRGLPETPRKLVVDFYLYIEGQKMVVSRDVSYKRTDPIAGEIFKPLEIVAPVSVKIQNSVYVFASDEPKEVEVMVKSAKEGIKGKVQLDIPDNWKVEPAHHDFTMKVKGEEKNYKFMLYPPDTQEEIQLGASATIGMVKFSRSLYEIDYDHVPYQMIYRPAKSKAVRVELKREGDRIGYIMGAGDDIPNSLEQIGYEVSMLDESKVRLESLQQFDAVILGIRAFNTNDKLNFLNQELFNYAEQGGTVIVQYNWTRGLVTNDVGPYPLKLSRDRVSVEEADIRILDSEHMALNYPNKISQKDFDGWVQERGLYFPDEWDENYTALFASNDPGESSKDGGLLVAQHGKGYYVYTGYSWFRQLPAGVPGAFRIFTNLISLGNSTRP